MHKLILRIHGAGDVRSPDDRDLVAKDLDAAKREADALLANDPAWDGPQASIVDEAGRMLATRAVDADVTEWVSGPARAT